MRVITTVGIISTKINKFTRITNFLKLYFNKI